MEYYLDFLQLLSLISKQTHDFYQQTLITHNQEINDLINTIWNDLQTLNNYIDYSVIYGNISIIHVKQIYKYITQIYKLTDNLMTKMNFNTKNHFNNKQLNYFYEQIKMIYQQVYDIIIASKSSNQHR